jgi:hypothetical protein
LKNVKKRHFVIEICKKNHFSRYGASIRPFYPNNGSGAGIKIKTLCLAVDNSKSSK